MAAKNVMQFLDLPRQDPKKAPVEIRLHDFREIYGQFKSDQAASQAGRCLDCGNPYCEWKCPVHNFIPNWLKLIQEGNLFAAAELSHQTNSLPEICGRICPQDRLCEGNCVIEQSGHGTVTIGAVERYLTDKAWEMGWVKPLRAGRARGQSVGVIGAGPAGLAAAERLRELGYEVTVYDRHDRPGGLMIYGIPSFKLEKDVVQRRTSRLAEGGIALVQGFEVGREATLGALRETHDALLIATGVYKARDLPCPGAGSGGVVAALDYLIASNRKGLGDAVAEFDSGELDAAGKRVVVVGGGDTAMDCVRTAVRQGAASVTCLYRRDKENMPGSAREVAHAEEEGVVFEWLAAPRAILGDAQRVTGVRTIRMRLGAPDSDGRQAPVEVEGGDFDLPCDLVIKALGFDPEDVPNLFGEPALEVSRWGTVKANLKTMMTNLPGVFAAGDIVRGASLVVWAIRDGRDASDNIHSYLKTKAETPALIAAE